MSRRGHREGSIYQRKDGRWVGAVSLPNGARKSFYGKTRKEVREKLTTALSDQQKGIPIAGSERQTVGEFLTAWLEGVRPTLRPRTYERYEAVIRLHIVPTLGRVRLRQLTPQQLQGLYAAKLGEGLTRTAGQTHGVLHRTLADALRWGLVARNVCDAVKPPKVPRQEMQALTPAQAKRLLAVAEGEPLETLYIMALMTGLRRGELLGLKWQDVDLEAGTLQVRRTLQRIKGMGFVEAEPKSAKSRRGIALIPQAVRALRQHHKRQLEARLRAAELWEDHGLVFCNGLGRPLEAGNVLRRSFRPLLEKAGLPRIRFHSLRHSSASLLLSLGVHPKIVQEILGHSSFNLTMDTYSHVMPTLQREALERLGDLLSDRT